MEEYEKNEIVEEKKEENENKDIDKKLENFAKQCISIYLEADIHSYLDKSTCAENLDEVLEFFDEHELKTKDSLKLLEPFIKDIVDNKEKLQTIFYTDDPDTLDIIGITSTLKSETDKLAIHIAENTHEPDDYRGLTIFKYSGNNTLVNLNIIYEKDLNDLTQEVLSHLEGEIIAQKRDRSKRNIDNLRANSKRLSNDFFSTNTIRKNQNNTYSNNHFHRNSK